MGIAGKLEHQRSSLGVTGTGTIVTQNSNLIIHLMRLILKH